MEFLERIGLEHPVVQAGMGGGVSGGLLAGAVSAAGALGTVGIMAPRAFARALHEARRRAPGKPVAANLLVPFTRRAHVDACIGAGAALVVFHGGSPGRWLPLLRTAGIPAFATVGTADQARAALSAGADGLVVQGLEAGGHLVGVQPLTAALPSVLEVAYDAPVLAAGGVAQSADVQRLLDGGAAAAVAGTRFLLTEESLAHPAYKERVLAAERTLVTLLFGFGWPLRHRVVPNAATRRWCSRSDLGPGWVRGLGRLSAVAGRTLPLSALDSVGARQRVRFPLFSPALPVAGMPPSSVANTALYAGRSLHRIETILPAADAVAELTP
jgi:NAD(P)H-dependent flavin oxidoreductase YrpB (nitropropane dioxygenase family)